VSVLSDGELETAFEMTMALVKKEVRALELVERAIGRAEAWQPIINAFSQLWAEEALQEARVVDAAMPGSRTPRSGIPLAVKDLFDVAGHETTGCCAAYRGNIREQDAPVIARVREVGLVMIGKTNQHELAAGGTNVVSACGPTANPWNRARITGGSSGGSAAAVAAGIVPFSLGSDTGGSVRIPSSMCGTFGLKPTTGLISIEGMLPLAPSMDTPGPIASTIPDLILLYDARPGRRTGSRGSSGWQVRRRLRKRRRRFRIGVPDGFFADRVHHEVLGVVSDVASILEGAGVSVEPVDGHGIEDARGVWARVCNPEFAAAHSSLRDRRHLVDPSVVAWMEEGERLTPEDRADAADRRRQIARWFRRKLRRVDALLIPTTPYPAPGHDQKIVDLGPGETVEVSRVGPGWLTCSVNLAGLPALNLPAGRSSEEVPIGASLVGGDNEEGTLFRLAGLWEEASGYRAERPPLPSNPLETAGPS
jgi:aspartyl-tRNA(Asn)/glutamyl-tRNA(Gln) amidotransferase subunit A